MQAQIARFFLVALICVPLFGEIMAQAPRRTHSGGSSASTKQNPSSVTATNNEQQDVETLKIDTNLVIVPVVATDSNGLYTSDLQQADFELWEEGVRQDIAFFATVSTPFHVVLMLDTSASTKAKLGLIQQAALAFVEQLQRGDQVKVISFDDQVNDLNPFTNDRAALKAAIYKTRSGEGTKLYDAFAMALDAVRNISGRKAIVLFTDGVDWRSDLATFESTRRGLDEEGVIVYPIRYNTRAETERLIRQQAEEQGPQLPTLQVIRTPPSGTTAPTFPSDDPESVPTAGTRSKTGPLGLPLPGEIYRRRGRTDPNRDGYPGPDRLPPPPSTVPDASRGPSLPTSRTGRREDDSIGPMLDQLYLTADSYLTELAGKSGGYLLRADTITSLPEVFARIAAELRTQYTLGYYPANKISDGQYRRIKVSSKRKNVILRARPGYVAPN